MADIEEGIGTRTRGKLSVIGYYKQTKDTAKLQKISNHSHPSVTKRYIDITAEEIEDGLAGFKPLKEEI